MTLFVERVEVQRGQVFHVRECESCQGRGWIHASAPRGSSVECADCDVIGETWDESCICPRCMEVLSELHGDELEVSHG